MSGGTARRKAVLGVLLWLALALPPARAVLESSMSLQMLVQMPLLAWLGGWLACALPRSCIKGSARWNHGGISGFLLAGLAGMVWMVPRMIDAALEQPWIAFAKFASIPLLVGAPLALSWPRAGFVIRGVVLVEAVATAFRLGWLYLASNTQLCGNYLVDDQRQLGRALLVLGTALCALLAFKLIWGRIRVDEVARP